MTDSFVTQCPHCQTSFRVTHHQLSVARGVVRCGQCLEVFNAARQLLEQSQAQTEAPVAEPVAVEPETPPSPAEPAPPQPRGQHDWTHTAQALDELDLDHELARLEQRNERPQRQLEPREESLQARRDEQHAGDHDDTPFGTAHDDHPDDDPQSQAAPVLVDQEPDAPLAAPEPERTEPTLGRTSDLEDEPVAIRVSARADIDDEPHPEDERLEPLLASPSPRTRREPLIEVVDDPLQLDWQKPPVNWGKRLMWMALVLLAAGLLAFQYVWFHFDEMARQDRYRPMFQQLCPTFGCKVPTRVDIGRIKSSNLVVRSHPDFKGALIVDAIIYNRAPFSQPFPLLELRFADLNGQLIASRRFKPAEYLSGELAGRGEMPSQTPIHIALDILDPGPKAVNYSLSFRSPE